MLLLKKIHSSIKFEIQQSIQNNNLDLLHFILGKDYTKTTKQE